MELGAGAPCSAFVARLRHFKRSYFIGVDHGGGPEVTAQASQQRCNLRRIDKEVILPNLDSEKPTTHVRDFF